MSAQWPYTEARPRQTPPKPKSLLAKEFGTTYYDNNARGTKAYRLNVGEAIFLTIITGGTYWLYVPIHKLLCKIP